MKEKELYKKAKKLQKTIVFPEAGFSDRILQAVKYIQKKKIAKPILIGDESALILRDKDMADFQIINPQTFQAKDQLAQKLYLKRKDKGMTLEQAQELVLDPYYFATLLVDSGLADGMVGGAESSTARTIKPALQIIKAAKKGGVVSSCFLMFGDNKFLNGKSLIMSDCGLNMNPTEDELSQIAIQSVETYRNIGLSSPKVAFLSFSTHGSAENETTIKMQNAYKKFKKCGVPCDGEIQFDAAMVKNVARHKCPESPINGNANILIFPDLNSGNICYKAMQYLGGIKAVGPILQGLKKPINDLSRGCSVEDIITVTAITALQANKEEK